MKLPLTRSGTVWSPLTPRGVAAFAHAPITRLLLVQLACGLLCGGCIAWFLSANWYPTITAAIHQLPPKGEIRSGRLLWTGPSPQVLAEGNFLAAVIDLNQHNSIRTPAHVQVAFGRNTVRFYSLLGYIEVPYPNPSRRIIVFNRTELEPWWGAWAPPLLAFSIAATAAILLALWSMLATLYSAAAWIIGFYANRHLPFLASWKLAGAALMPGALILSLAIALYGAGMLDLTGLLAATAVHLVIGWLYVLVSPFFAPKLSSNRLSRGNPFAKPDRR